jgi:hypothetical protein
VGWIMVLFAKNCIELKIGKVVYKDYSRGTEPFVQEFNVNLNERYSNITDPYKLVSLIVVKALWNTTIASLANFNLDGLKGTISDTLSSHSDESFSSEPEIPFSNNNSKNVYIEGEYRNIHCPSEYEIYNYNHFVITSFPTFFFPSFSDIVYT